MTQEQLRNLQEEQKDAIQKYIEQRLGHFYGNRLHEAQWSWESSKQADYGSMTIPRAAFGIFGYMLKSATIEATVYKGKYPRTVGLAFRYVHSEGGRNGHELDFGLLVHQVCNKEARVYEVSR